MNVGLTAPPAHGAGGEAKMSVMRPIRSDASVKVGVIQLRSPRGIAALVEVCVNKTKVKF